MMPIAASKMSMTCSTGWNAWHARAMNNATLAEIVSRIALLDRLDRDDEGNSNCVRLMTFHAAKGLEFPHVFMVGMEENLLPHRSSIEADNFEEERRLTYVGITRAQKTLTLTYASKRRRAGEWESREPSRFLSELPADDLEWDKPGTCGARRYENSAVRRTWRSSRVCSLTRHDRQ